MSAPATLMYLAQLYRKSTCTTSALNIGGVLTVFQRQAMKKNIDQYRLTLIISFFGDSKPLSRDLWIPRVGLNGPVTHHAQAILMSAFANPASATSGDASHQSRAIPDLREAHNT